MTSFVMTPWASPAGVSSVLVEGPTEEPLTLEEGKQRAGFTWVSPDPRDDLMLGFIAAARAKVEQDTGLACLTQTRDVTIVPADGLCAIPWQAWPVQSIETLVPTPAGIVRCAIAPARHATLTAWSALFAAGGAWRIIAGWPSAAELKMQAPLLVHAIGLLTAHFATAGRDLATDPLSLVPLGYADAIAPYVLVVV